jgi:hypothetical protein
VRVVVGVDHLAICAKSLAQNAQRYHLPTIRRICRSQRAKACVRSRRYPVSTPMSNRRRAWSRYIPAGSPGISAIGLPGGGPAGSRYLQGEIEHLRSTRTAQNIYHIQDWYDREFGLEWARDVHRPTNFEERVHRVMDSVRLGFAVRALKGDVEARLIQ